MLRTKKIILAQSFEGLPKESDFQLVEEDLPALKDGEILCEAVWISVDPLNKVLAQLNKTVIAAQIAKIIESRNQEFPVGEFVIGYMGWQTLTVHDPRIPVLDNWSPTHLIPKLESLPLSLGLGAVGMPGNTAYFGFLEICRPKVGEVVVVSGAAGAVGSLVGQIARIKGCKVIGFTGSDVKVQWLKNELHFDAAYNYKTVDIDEVLKEAAPNGVDCYFDNVGGVISNIVMSHMKQRGRISVCGYISGYCGEVPLVPMIQSHFPMKHLTMEGFLVFEWWDRWMEGLQQMSEWVRNKQIICQETITQGFENLPEALTGLYTGENIGKAIVKV